MWFNQKHFTMKMFRRPSGFLTPRSGGDYAVLRGGFRQPSEGFLGAPAWLTRCYGLPESACFQRFYAILRVPGFPALLDSTGAAADLGATPWTAFWKVTVPLSKAGILAGSMLVFIPCVGEFVIPELLGGPETLMIGRVLWDEFFSNNDWPMASSVAVVMVLLVIVPLAIFNKYQAEAQEKK